MARNNLRNLIDSSQLIPGKFNKHKKDKEAKDKLIT